MVVSKNGSHRNRAEIIKKRLKVAFEDHPNITNKAVADYCKVSEQAVWKWRKTGKIKRDLVPVVAAFFGHGTEWLLDEDGDKRPAELTVAERPSQTERDIINALRSMPPDIAIEIKQHILAMSKIFARTDRA